MRLDINHKKKTVRNTNTWRLNNTFLNNQQVTEEIKRELKKFLETNDNENTTTQKRWDGDFPGGPGAKTPCSQCKGSRFNPWSGN